MKKSYVRITYLLLAVIMLVTFAACSGKQTPLAPKGGDSGKANNDTQGTEPLRISFVSPNWEDAPDFNNEWWSRFFKETNTIWDITFVPSSDYPTKYDLILASGDLPDIIMSEDANRPSTVQAIRNGAFWDLTDYLGDFSKYPNLRDNPTPNAFKYASYQGRIYAIPRSRPQLDENLSIRKDWLDKLNLKMPTTLDEFKNVLKVIVESDPDENGLDDTIGLVGWNYRIQDAHKGFMNAFGCYSTTPNADGGLDHPDIKEEIVDYVNFLHELYELNIISKEFSVMTTTQAEDFITSGKAACYGYNIWRTYDYTQRTKVSQPEAEFIVIPPMKGPRGTTAVLEKGVYGFFHIAKSKVDEKKLLRILDFYEQTCTEYWLDKGYYGWEGVHYTVNEEGTKVMTDIGKVQIGTGIQQPLPMMANTWAKVVCVTAPKSYNDWQLEYCQPIVEQGNTMTYDVLVSPTWTDVWPKYQKEYETNFVKAVVGQMSIEDFRQYVAGLRALPEFKKAAKEFKESYDNIFGN